MTPSTNHERRLPNYLRIHRRNSGFSQTDIADALGYRNQGPISRHEHFLQIPSLEIAIGYEVIFRIPVSEIFAGMRDAIENAIEQRLTDLESRLGEKSIDTRDANLTARKLIWLAERKDSAN